MLPRERLEHLEAALERLRRDAREAMVLVEGPKDVAALEHLRVRGDIRVINQGTTLVHLVDTLAASGAPRTVILLQDWDRTGGTLQRTLAPLLRARGFRVDEDHRRVLAQLAGGDARDVEGLPAFVRNLREQVGRPI